MSWFNEVLVLMFWGSGLCLGLLGLGFCFGFCFGGFWAYLGFLRHGWGWCNMGFACG